VRFHCGYCGRDGHKDEFCFKKKREERMAKEWANKDKYHPSIGVLEPHVQMPRAKASVRIVPAWGERKAAGGVVRGYQQDHIRCHQCNLKILGCIIVTNNL
jgi:hypothetical protein